MVVIGFRCFPDAFSYVVLGGSQSDPLQVGYGKLALPKGLGWSAKLAWLRKQIIELLMRYEVERAGIKAPEPMAKMKSLARSELEGIVKEAVFAHLGVECTSRIKSQLKRDIVGFDEPARYIDRALSAVSLNDVNNQNFHEAALAAVAELD